MRNKRSIFVCSSPANTKPSKRSPFSGNVSREIQLYLIKFFSPTPKKTCTQKHQRGYRGSDACHDFLTLPNCKIKDSGIPAGKMGFHICVSPSCFNLIAISTIWLLFFWTIGRAEVRFTALQGRRQETRETHYGF